jgi:hypothetical protein
LLDDWRRLWLDREPEADTPGIVRVERGTRTQVVSSDWQVTARALEAQGAIIVRTAALDLTEILEHLMWQETTVATGAERPLVLAPG